MLCETSAVSGYPPTTQTTGIHTRARARHAHYHTHDLFFFLCSLENASKYVSALVPWDDDSVVPHEAADGSQVKLTKKRIQLVVEPFRPRINPRSALLEQQKVRPR